jgi:hypothetical protein
MTETRFTKRPGGWPVRVGTDADLTKRPPGSPARTGDVVAGPTPASALVGRRGMRVQRRRDPFHGHLSTSVSNPFGDDPIDQEAGRQS